MRLTALVLMASLAGTAPNGGAQNGRADSVSFTLTSPLVPGPVDVGVLLPPAYDASGPPLPVLLFLQSPEVLFGYRATYENLWASGHLPRMVIVSPAARRSLYMDYRDGTQRWETFILDEVLRAVQHRFRAATDRSNLLVCGYSQGGVGALRMGFKYPERFLAVAAWAPGVEPALSFAQIDSSDRAHRSQELYEEIFGKPVDERYWQANHPLYLLQTRVGEIARSGLRVYLAVGGADQFNLFRGSAALHSILEAAAVKHDYHLVADATHGTIFTGRLEEGLRFLGASVRPTPR